MKYLKQYEGWLHNENSHQISGWRIKYSDLIKLKPNIDECLLDLSDMSCYKNVEYITKRIGANGIVYTFFINDHQEGLDDRFEEMKDRIKDIDKRISVDIYTNNWNQIQGSVLGIVILISNRTIFTDMGNLEHEMISILYLDYIAMNNGRVIDPVGD